MRRLVAVRRQSLCTVPLPRLRSHPRSGHLRLRHCDSHMSAGPVCAGASAEGLAMVKLDMPELQLEAGQPRRIEMRETPQQPWNEYVIDRFGADGRVRLSYPGGAAQTRKWVDLTKCEYRWLA